MTDTDSETRSETIKNNINTYADLKINVFDIINSKPINIPKKEAKSANTLKKSRSTNKLPHSYAGEEIILFVDTLPVNKTNKKKVKKKSTKKAKKKS
jgi:hypothetical protein